MAPSLPLLALIFNSFKPASSALNVWLGYRDEFLADIIERASPPLPVACTVCGGLMEWRCEDCFGEPVFCTTCCRKSHEHSPFHRVQHWTGKTFVRSALRKTGLTLFMGHGGSPCPSMISTGHGLPFTPPQSVSSSVASSTSSSPVHESVSLPTCDDLAQQSPLRHAQQHIFDLIDDDRPDQFDHFDLSTFGPVDDSPPPTPPPMSSPPDTPQRSRATSPSEDRSFRQDFDTSQGWQSPSSDTSETDSNHMGTESEGRDSTSDVNALLFDDEDGSDDEDLEFESGGIFTSSMKFPRGLDDNGNQWMTIVDITGVHHLPVHFCDCATDIRPYRQLLRLSLYPATYDRPETVFTFRVLEDFHLENLETKASAQRYYAKLRRLTSNAFPQSVPDRYREFMRIMREWRNLEQRKRAGTHYSKSAPIAPGGLALFCPACPQPGVNLPDGWDTEPDQYASSQPICGGLFTHSIDGALCAPS